MNKEHEYKKLFWDMVAEYAHDREYAPSNVDYRKGKIAGFNSVMCITNGISQDFFGLVSSTTWAVVTQHK